MRSARPRPDRGMVTAELAVGMLAVLVVTVMMAWCLHLVTRQLLLEDAAAEIARQAARGDLAAVTAARRDAPPGAVIELSREAGSVVARARLSAGGPEMLPSVELTAVARVLVEPGEAS